MKLSFHIRVVFAFFACCASGQAQPVLKLENGVVLVVRLPTVSATPATFDSAGQWGATLSVYTHEAYVGKAKQPIAGTYSRRSDSLIFKPAYPFAPGEMYHAVFEAEALPAAGEIVHDSKLNRLELSFSIPAEIQPKTEVESIYPESDNLPENLLRMYICFSAPMMPGEAYDRIRLMREDGTSVEKAFLIVDQELWDHERRRFTLLFDPGRIKRELKSNIDLGTPLEEGERYHLVIDSAWRDVYGKPLRRSITKTFKVTPAERTKVSPRQWRVIPPLAGTLNEIGISFDRPIDHALALKYISIRSSAGQLTGHAQMVNDLFWKFTPDHPWENGEYVVTISPLLEDVSGNNLNNPFDLDLSKGRRENSMEPAELPIRVSGFAR